MFDPAALHSRLAAENPVVCCKDVIASANEQLNQQFRDGAAVDLLIRQRAAFVDALLGVLWDRHPWQSDDQALVAVGGYGRGELHPHSDVDLLILLGED